MLLWYDVGEDVKDGSDNVSGDNIYKERAEPVLVPSYYELKSLELDKRTNSCIRVNTRELDRKLFTN